MLVVDVSGSMRAKDVKPSRLAAAKRAMRSFLDRAPTALGRDRRLLGRAARRRLADGRPRRPLAGDRPARPGLRDRDRRRPRARGRARRSATAETGEGDQAPARALKDEDGRSLASILLLSDGAQTRGLLSPGPGGQRAQVAGIPVFTIALGTDGRHDPGRPPGQEQLIPVPPDRETLAAIAEYTGAQAYDAESADALEKVYAGLGLARRPRRRPREVTAMFVARARCCSRAARASRC